MAAKATIEVSVTELPHFRHLVDFLHAVEDLAQERDDDQLTDLVTETRHNLEQAWRER
jgi:hypothetical protein